MPRAKFYPAVRLYRSTADLIGDLNTGALDHRQTLGMLASDLGSAWTPQVLFGVDPAANRVQWTRLSPECFRVEYSVNSPGIVFVSETFYPGWEAVDDRGRQLPVVRTFLIFKGIVLREPGTGAITVRFRPASFRLGACLSAATALALLALAFFLRRRPPGPAGRA
jgi:hypothetical protein